MVSPINAAMPDQQSHNIFQVFLDIYLHLKQQQKIDP